MFTDLAKDMYLVSFYLMTSILDIFSNPSTLQSETSCRHILINSCLFRNSVLSLSAFIYVISRLFSETPDQIAKDFELQSWAAEMVLDKTAGGVGIQVGKVYRNVEQKNMAKFPPLLESRCILYLQTKKSCNIKPLLYGKGVKYYRAP